MAVPPVTALAEEFRAGLEGVGLRPLLNNPAASVKEAALTQAPRPPNLQSGQSDTMGDSVRDERFRYTEWRQWRTGRLQATELYDHDHDPDEKINRAANPALAAARAALALARAGRGLKTSARAITEARGVSGRRRRQPAGEGSCRQEGVPEAGARVPSAARSGRPAAVAYRRGENWW